MTIRHQQHSQQHTQRFCGVFFIFSLMILFTSVGFYLFSINAIALQGNNTHRSEKKIQDLTREWRRLQIEVAELSSLHRVKDQEAEFQAILSEEILYIAGGPLALR